VFLVRKRSEIVRFGLFLALAGLMAWFVASRAELFQNTAARPGAFAPADVAENEKPDQGQPSDNRRVVEAAPSDGAAFFAEFRIDREQMRAARAEQLQAMIDNPNVDADTRKAAAGDLRAVQRMAALESQAETMVKAKGFTDVVVMLTEQSVQVVVRAAGLTPQQAMQVLDTVSRVTGMKPAAIAVTAKDR
jgi:stage III sporulation protein AH